MASLLEIKKKIGGVKNTQKITKAMKLVATSKMKLFQRKALSTRHYVWDLLKALERNLSENSKNIYTRPRKKGKVLFVLYTSDKGLCGGMNSNLLRAIFRSKKWLDLKPEERILITIGKKAYEFARSNKITVDKHFLGLAETFKINDIFSIIDEVLNRWHNGEAKEVIFVAPHFKNTFTFYPVLKTFLPFSREMIHEQVEAAEAKVMADDEKKEYQRNLELDQTYMIYEPDKNRVVEVLFMQIIQSLFVQTFFELKASEYSSRMLAMQNATDAAGKVITNLTRVYNKTRQQVITQQIAEIITSAESI